ncbi:MAG: hypothetical protein HY908_32000 [Myxococcales bacterium]|nr:hypothetical protein [Myxococcales bacterium]
MRTSVKHGLLGVAVILAAAAGACASGQSGDGAALATGSGGAGAGGADSGGNGQGAGGGFNGGGCGLSVLDDLGVGVSAADAAVFAEPAGAQAPLVFDPPSGALVPDVWPSPRFLVHTSAMPALAALELVVGGETLRFTAIPEAAPKAHDDSTVTGAWWTIALPDATWEAVRCLGAEIGWSVRWAAAGAAAPAGETTGELRLLGGLAEAPDLNYLEIVQPDSVQAPSDFAVQRLALESGTPQTLATNEEQGCIGCHAVSPDGADLAYQTLEAGWRVKVMRPHDGAPPTPSPFVSPSAQALLDTTSLTVPSMARDAWSDATGHWLAAVGSDGALGLVELDAPQAKLFTAPKPGTGGTVEGELSVATPAFAPGADRVVFVATDGMVDGYFWQGSAADLWQVPVTVTHDGAPAFGAPAPLPHVGTTAENETYPTFSRDGALLSYTRTAPGTGGYDEETAEIWVMPADGSHAPTRLVANDAPSDSVLYAGAGHTNSWSRFGDTTLERPEGTYYFLLFSSRRGDGQLWEDRSVGSNYIAGRPIARLYLATVLLQPNGVVASFPGVLVPDQRVDAGAHTANLTAITSVPPPPAN